MNRLCSDEDCTHFGKPLGGRNNWTCKGKPKPMSLATQCQRHLENAFAPKGTDHAETLALLRRATDALRAGGL